MNGPLVRYGALGVLTALALVLSINLFSATGRFVDAFEAYDQLDLELTGFTYTNVDVPIETTFRITNPTDRTIDILSIELRINAGVRRVGGGEVRPQPMDAVPSRLAAGASAEWSIPLAINDRTYVGQLDQRAIDWQMTGRIFVRVDADIREEWIPFRVGEIPTTTP